VSVHVEGAPTALSATDGRPTAVTIVAALAVLAAGYLIVDGVLTLRDADRDNTGEIVNGILPVAQGLVALVVAAGALRMRAWAWKLFMTLAVIGLTIQILRHFSFGDARYARMALDAFIVFALTPRDVQVAFGIRARRAPRSLDHAGHRRHRPGRRPRVRPVASRPRRRAVDRRSPPQAARDAGASRVRGTGASRRRRGDRGIPPAHLIEITPIA
jgi:hypothetical protein